MRKLLMLSVVVLAAFAVSAPSAGAATLPYNDSNPENWSPVLAWADSSVDEFCEGHPDVGEGNCDFASDEFTDEFNWGAYLQHPIMGAYSLGDCAARVEGGVDGSGTVRVRVVGGGCFSQGPPNLVVDDYWDGQACYHEPTGEVWFRQQAMVTDGVTVWDGVMFGLHDSDGYNVDFGGSMLEFTPATGHQFWNASGTAKFPLASEVEIVPDSEHEFYPEEEPCWWPETSA
jgi:hypothetical protein